MRKFVLFIILSVVLAIGLVSCAIPRQTSVSNSFSLEKYKYFVLGRGTSIESVKSYTSVNSTFGYSNTYSRNANTDDIISAYLIKRGLICLPNIQDSFIGETLIINCYKSNSRTGILGSVTEVTMQFLSVQPYSVLCVVTAEALEDTEADDIRVACIKCLDAVCK